MELSQLVMGVGHLGIAVSDMKQSVAYYTAKPGFTGTYHKVVVDTSGNALDITMMQLGNLELELVRPASGCTDARSCRGAWDHFAIDAPDFDACVKQALDRSMEYDVSTPDGPVYYDAIGDKGVLGANFAGPDNEVIELCHNCAKHNNHTGLRGWSHLALKVPQLAPVINFYEKLGFSICDDGSLETDDKTWQIIFMALGDFQLEIIESGKKQSGSGVLDHLALEVQDVNEALRLCRENNMTILTPLPKELSLFEHGIRYIMLEGAAGEKVELFQRLQFGTVRQ